MNKIQKTYKKLEDIHTLNYGGCLIAAYAVYKKNINNTKIQIVQISSYLGDSDLYRNKEFILGNSKIATSGHHFGITMDNGVTIYDSKGIIQDDDEKLIIPRNKTHEFCKSAILKSRWNNSFDRKKYVPIIFKRLKIKIKFLNNIQ